VGVYSVQSAGGSGLLLLGARPLRAIQRLLGLYVVVFLADGTRASVDDRSRCTCDITWIGRVLHILAVAQKPNLEADDCHGRRAGRRRTREDNADSVLSALAIDLVVFPTADPRQILRTQWLREIGMLAVRLAIGIYVLNVGYLGEGSFTKLNEFQFVSDMFGGKGAQASGGWNRFRGSLLGELYVPFPRNYVIGIDALQRECEDLSLPSYLRGHYNAKGWWYYYAYAILVKTPVGTLGLMAMAFAVQFTRFRARIDWGDTIMVLAPPVVIFVVVSMKSGFSHHSRYILPCVPFVFIWISQLTRLIHAAHVAMRDHFSRRATCRSLKRETRISTALGILAASLMSWALVSSLWVYPHSLSYFNCFVGGPRSGPNHLINSNIDWGQDLLFLEQWNGERSQDVPVHLAFYNFFNPFDLEIAGTASWSHKRGESSADVQIADGFYAISVNLLFEFPWYVRDAEGLRYRIDTRPLAHLRSVEPVGWAGYSIRIFSAEQMRAAYQVPISPPLWSGFDGDER